jgi:peptide/nickel transport system substrate-binding protein
MEGNRYWERWQQRFSRRRVLQGAALSGAAVAVAGAVGCGGSSNKASPTAAPRAQGSATAAGGTAARPAQPSSSATAASATAAAVQPKRGGELVTYLVEDPADWNDWASIQASKSTMLNLIRDRVFFFETGPSASPTSLKIIPGLAERWEQTDPTSLTLHLRQGVKWHDGSDFTSQDVAASILLQRDTQSNQFAYHFDWVSAIQTPDASTAVIKTSQPFGSLIPNLAQIYSDIAPKALVDKGHEALKASAIGTGPVMLKEASKGVRYVLAKNPNYYVKGIPYVDQITYLILPDPTAIQSAFIAGQLHVLALGLNGTLGNKGTSDTVLARAKGQLEKYPNGAWQALALNAAKPPLNDSRVRQAISLAIDRPVLNQLVRQNEGYINAVVPSTLGDFLPKDPLNDLPNLKRDVAKAKQLLAAAGNANGFVLEIEYSQEQTENKDTTELLQQQLAEAGIKVNILPMEHVAHLAYFAQKKFTGVCRVNAPFQEPDDYIWAFFYSKGARNGGGWGKPELDTLLEQQRQATDTAQRQKLVLDAQKLITGEAYYPPLTDGPVYYHWRGEVKNFRPHFSGSDRVLTTSWIDKS